jgi:uncharacterized protein YcfJ
MPEPERAPDPAVTPNVGAETGPRPVRAAVFRKIRRADEAVAALAAAGFTKDHITVICPTCTTERFQEYQQREPAGSHSAKAAAGGGAIGALLGGLGVAGGYALAGGVGLLVAGPLLAGAGGALAGGFIGAMLARGVERETTNFYDQALRRGDILVAAETERGPDADARLAQAERIFAELGAEPIELRRE